MRRLGLVLAGLALVAGCGYGGVPAAESPAVNGDPVVTAPVVQAAVPVSISIPKLDVTDEIVPVAVKPDGAMDVPPVDKTGWWSEATRPGDVGVALVLSHVSYKGAKGAFNRLVDLREGDEIDVLDADGVQHRFAVVERRTFKKSAFIENHDLLFANRGTSDLVAVTCGGTLIGHSFDSNVAVRARAV
jgi:hypothetical protein